MQGGLPGRGKKTLPTDWRLGGGLGDRQDRYGTRRLPAADFSRVARAVVAAGGHGRSFAAMGKAAVTGNAVVVERTGRRRIFRPTRRATGTSDLDLSTNGGNDVIFFFDVTPGLTSVAGVHSTGRHGADDEFPTHRTPGPGGAVFARTADGDRVNRPPVFKHSSGRPGKSC